MGRCSAISVILALFIGLVARPLHAASAAEERSVAATASCRPASVDVTVVNQSGDELTVGFARALTGADGSVSTISVGTGQSIDLVLPISAGLTSGGGGALVVTSAGRLVPTCAGPAAQLALGDRPASEAERSEAAASVAARTISLLEGMRAFDALYAVMHADARARVSEAQVACWYADYLAGRDAEEVSVLGVTFGAWTWDVNGTTYDAAEVSYRQRFGTGDGAEDVEAVGHLVLERGLWRWFLGTDASWLAGLPEQCDAAPSAGDTISDANAPGAG